MRLRNGVALSFVAIAVAGVALVAAACGGGKTQQTGGNVTFSPLTPLTSAATEDTPNRETTPSPTATPTEDASPSPSPSPTEDPTPTTASDPKTAAYDAALQIFDAVPASDCSSNNPDGKSCLNWSTTASTPALGVAAFNVGSPQGGGAMMVTGEQPGGGWAIWFGTQQALYQAVALPADMIVCAGGNGLDVHESYSASSGTVDTVSDGAVVRAEQFVLTAAGSAGVSGSGWYRLSSPVEGWADATDLSVASLGDCSFHDALQGNSFDRG